MKTESTNRYRETDTGTASSTIPTPTDETGSPMGMAVSYTRTTDHYDWRIAERDSKCRNDKFDRIEANNRFTRNHRRAIKAIKVFLAKILYYLRLSKAEYSGKNFCKI